MSRKIDKAINFNFRVFEFVVFSHYGSFIVTCRTHQELTLSSTTSF